MTSGDTFTIRDYTFRVELEPDDSYDGRFPWDEYDGNGVIDSTWHRRDWNGQIRKRPGQRVLFEDRGQYLLYDWDATIAKATREQWGLAPDECKGLTRKQIVARAVERDFKRWHGWCTGAWEYLVVVVTLLSDDGEPTVQSASLGGVESDCTGFIEECARDLAREILSRVEVDDPDVQLSEN